MKLGMLGLGRMGGNMARRLARGGHDIVVYDRDADAVKKLVDEGVAQGAGSVAEMREKLGANAIYWVMVPAGKATESVIEEIAADGRPEETIIDGGNSFYKDDIRRAKTLRAKGLHYVDVGTSGGVWGLERGYCMMIGGDPVVIRRLDPIFATLAPGLGDIERTSGRSSRDDRPERGYFHAGPAGSGHFVKMVHNGIEYGLMQAYAEGFDILRNKDSQDLPEDERFSIKLDDVAEVWRRGSVISSWLLDLSAQALAKDPQLDGFRGDVADSGEGRWTIEAAIEEAVSAEVLSAALFARFRSRRDHTFGEKLLSAMRFGFGGHVEIPQ